MRAAIALVLTLGLITSAAADGPSCTPTYPRGFKVATTKKQKRRQLPTCTNGELGATWGTCALRYNT